MRLQLHPFINPRAGTRWLGLLLVLLTSGNCGTSQQSKQQQPFFTSGSPEADQRASQRVTQSEQIADSGQGNSRESKKDEKKGNEAEATARLTLYERLGGRTGIGAIVEDFVARILEDPRVNWERKGMMRGPFFFRREQPPAWIPTPDNIATLKKHMMQFIALATGGPADYDGKDIKTLHEGMEITNPEFDAVAGDLKASLDRLNIGDREQKELLAIFESTRPQIVTVR